MAPEDDGKEERIRREEIIQTPWYLSERPFRLFGPAVGVDFPDPWPLAMPANISWGESNQTGARKAAEVLSSPHGRKDVGASWSSVGRRHRKIVKEDHYEEILVISGTVPHSGELGRGRILRPWNLFILRTRLLRPQRPQLLQ
jgi:hypothetical protein